MATTFSKRFLSGSTNGRPIKVAAVATPGTLVHTAIAGTADLDEIWLWAINTSNAPRQLTLEWGGVTSPDDHIVVTLEPRVPALVMAGAILNNALVARAFASLADVVNVFGFVNRVETT